MQPSLGMLTPISIPKKKKKKINQVLGFFILYIYSIVGSGLVRIVLVWVVKVYGYSKSEIIDQLV